MNLIYLASPYTHDDKAIQAQRFDQVCEYAAKLMLAGFHVFSPIAHGHSIARYGLPGDFDYWRTFCELTLGRCDAMLVLQLDGWTESAGVTHEVSVAAEKGLPVEFVAPFQMPINIPINKERAGQ